MPTSQPAENNTPATTVLASALAIACALPASAHAQEQYAALDSILVVGQRQPDANPNANENAPYKIEKSADDKFTEPLRDTPKSITAIPKEVIEDQGATTLREVVRNQPGVTLGTGEGGNAFGDRIFIRGFEARNDVYIDGMRDPGVTSREIFAVEQIEIVKGPSSSFGGRGTTGGSLSLQSKRPAFNDFVIAEGSVGTENMYRATLDVNRKLTDTLAVRVNGLYHSSDTPGRDYVEQERYGATASALWTPVEGLELKGDYYHFRLDGVPDYGHPFDVDTQQPFKVDRDNFYGAVGRDFLKNGADIGTVIISYRPMDALKLRSMTRYGKTFNDYIVSVPRAPTRIGSDPANWTVSTGAPQRNANNKYLANITDATFRFATGGIGHTLVAGLEYADEQVTARRFAFPATVEDASGNIIATPGGFVRNLVNPDPVLGYKIPALLDTTPPIVTNVETFSTYLLDTIKITPQIEALLGIRYDDYAIELTQAAGTTRAGQPVSARRLVNNTDFLNYQASLIYKPVEAASVYVSYSTSSNPTGEQLDGSGASYDGIAPQTQNLEPERNTSWELGAKYELAGGDLLLTAAAFRITKENAREQVAPNVYDTVGELRAQGLEFGVNGNITPRLSVFGGYTWLDAKVRKATNPANEGGRFPNVSQHSFSLLATYKITDRFTLGGQAYYQDEIFGGTSVSGTAHVPGYWRFDAVARYHVTDHAELRLNVLNLTDKVYYDAIYRSGTPFAYIAPGRSANLSLALHF